MPAPFVQADLFADLLVEADPVRAPAPRRPRGRAVVAPDHEAAARAIEATEDFKVLRRLRPRPVDHAYRLADGEQIAVVVDVETTGLDPRADEVIEIGMVAFVYGRDGRVGPVTAAVSLLREPSVPIGPQITKLTGITPEMVAGAVLDIAAVRSVLAPASLVIAHNARFDRPFCERLHDDFVHKAWACSVAELRWAEFGYEGAKLGALVTQNGWFHRGHRAVDDCHALLEVLSAPLADGTGSAFHHLLDSSRRTRVRLWAEQAPFDQKDVLKRRGYRWNGGEDGRPKAWWTEVDADAFDDEIRFLEGEVYRRAVNLRRDVVTAHERYRLP